jgi:CDP-4-dehydro-6-deoxyglucose reductase
MLYLGNIFLTLADMAYDFFPSKIVDIVDEAPNVKRFFIQVGEEPVFHFKPGQFVMLDLPLDSKIKTRSYSIASPPNGSNVIELIIVLKEDGLGTNYLFTKNTIKIGSELKVSKAIGKFTLPETLESNLCFICTGTGIAPFRSQLNYLFNHNLHNPNFNIHLIFGCRWEKDILYRKEFEKFEAICPCFSYHPVLSREPNWDGYKGYVHQVYEELYSDGKPAQFYLCGWKEMIMQAKDKLLGFGYEKSAIRFELYD